MPQNNHIKIFAVIMALALSAAVSGQNSTSSPYSLYGVGILAETEDASEMGLGHAGVALAPTDHVNASTPAGISNLDSLTFYFNFQMKAFYAHAKTYTQGQSVYSANIDGINMGFRPKKWWAVALGYAPYSTVGYNMTDREQYIIGTQTKYTTRYTGSGGLQRAYMNHAFTLFDHVTLAASAGALWGSITKTETVYFSDAIGGENVYNTKKYTMNNFFFEYGVQFHFTLGAWNNFRFGAKYSNKTALKSSYDHIVSNDISNELFFDDVTPLKEEFTVPRSYALGMAFTRRKFLATLDYHSNKWGSIVNSKFRETARFVDNWSLGGGVQWSFGRPEDPFFKRLKVRLGGYFSTSYLGMGSRKYQGSHFDEELGLMIPDMDNSNKSLYYKAVTAGLTIPMGRFSNSLIVGYEYLKHGTRDAGLVEEQFHNFKIAFNIRETWFVKSKFD